MEEKHYCWLEGCENEISKPEYCGCKNTGKNCGCMGLPKESPFCCEAHQDKWFGSGVVEPETKIMKILKK